MKLEGAWVFYGSNPYELHGIPDQYDGNDDDVIEAICASCVNVSPGEIAKIERPEVPGFSPPAIGFTARHNAIVVTYVPD